MRHTDHKEGDKQRGAKEGSREARSRVEMGGHERNRRSRSEG